MPLTERPLEPALGLPGSSTTHTGRYTTPWPSGTLHPQAVGGADGRYGGSPEGQTVTRAVPPFCAPATGRARAPAVSDRGDLYAASRRSARLTDARFCMSGCWWGADSTDGGADLGVAPKSSGPVHRWARLTLGQMRGRAVCLRPAPLSVLDQQLTPKQLSGLLPEIVLSVSATQRS